MKSYLKFLSRNKLYTAIEFVGLAVSLAFVILIGVPVAIFLSERYLRQFYYRIDGYGWVFVVGAVIALVISFLAVLWQTLRAARTNPATELKKE